jgi:hypothetical protein
MGGGRWQLVAMTDGWFVEDDSVIVPERAAAACALAAWEGWAYLAWTGSDFRINLASSSDGRSFGKKATFRHRTVKTIRTSSHTPGEPAHVSSTSTRRVGLAPALAGAPGGPHLGWTGMNTGLNLWRPGQGEAGHVELDERSVDAPALTTWGPDTVVAWAGTDTRLNLLYLGRVPGGHHIVLEETSRAAPAVCDHQENVVLAWTGTDRHVNVLRAGSGSLGRPLRLDATTNASPAVCPAGDGVALAWTGSDRHVNVVLLDRAGPGPSTRLEGTTNYAPALCRFGEGILLGWTGSDGRPNVSRLALVH